MEKVLPLFRKNGGAFSPEGRAPGRDRARAESERNRYSKHTHMKRPLILISNDDSLLARGVNELARIAFLENESNENIGARRLHTVMEMLLEDVSFSASGGHEDVELVIDKKYVAEHMEKATKNLNLRKYIL